MKLRWSLRAREDLRAVGRYIARDNPKAARAWVARLTAAARTAANLPRAGRIVPEIANPDYREVLLRSYRIVYRIERDGKSIVVLMVFEGHKLLDPSGIE
jgi:toxin ParE1/3/4